MTYTTEQSRLRTPQQRVQAIAQLQRDNFVLQQKFEGLQKIVDGLLISALNPPAEPPKNTTTLTWHKSSELLPESDRFVLERPVSHGYPPRVLYILPGTRSQWASVDDPESPPEEWAYLDGAIAQ